VCVFAQVGVRMLVCVCVREREKGRMCVCVCAVCVFHRELSVRLSAFPSENCERIILFVSSYNTASLCCYLIQYGAMIIVLLFHVMICYDTV
jgi:hypothetical protein